MSRACPGKRTAIPVPSGSTPKTKSVISRRDATEKSGNEVGRVCPGEEGLPTPSQLQKRVFKQALTQFAQEKKKVRTLGAAKSLIAQPKIATKRGKECVLQQMKLETTVQRTPKAEYIGRTVVGIDVDESGTARQIEMTSQQIDPAHGTESAGVNETVSTTNTLSVTSGGKQLKKSVKKRTVTSEKLATKPNLNKHHVSRLVIEEIEDVENTLKMVPPNLVSTSVEKFPLKKKIQTLRLTSEPVNILTRSIMQPTPTADEADAEAPPEVLASVIHAVERGANPDSAPNQIFNSLFPEVVEDRIAVSSVARGPLEDIVVPAEMPRNVVEEALSQEMEEIVVEKVQNAEQSPTPDICTERNIVPVATADDTENAPIPGLLEGELPPWEDNAITKVAAIVGGEPINLLDVSDISEMSPTDLNQELSKGIEYFIDADVVPHETKIQIRGSKWPRWFPGYMTVLPHLPGLVKITECPNEVFKSAWKAVQPKVFPEDSLLVL